MREDLVNEARWGGVMKLGGGVNLPSPKVVVTEAEYLKRAICRGLS